MKLKQELSEKQPKIIEHLHHQKHFCVCSVCIKCGKSAKKHTKNVKLKLLTREDTFG